jgi:hypothetical protein
MKLAGSDAGELEGGIERDDAERAVVLRELVIDRVAGGECSIRPRGDGRSSGSSELLTSGHATDSRVSR